MFRKMRRFKQELSQQECIEVLIEEPRGVLSVLGDDGYPYGMPMNQWYDEKSGKIYFHGAKTGHKIDAIKNNDKVSFCIYDEGYRNRGEWALNIRSVIIFGHIRIVEDEAKKVEICTNICQRFTYNEEYLKNELERGIENVQCLELTIDHMSGKLVKES